MAGLKKLCIFHHLIMGLQVGSVGCMVVKSHGLDMKLTDFCNSLVQQVIQLKTRLDMVRQNKNSKQQCRN